MPTNNMTDQNMATYLYNVILYMNEQTTHNQVDRCYKQC